MGLTDSLIKDYSQEDLLAIIGVDTVNTKYPITNGHLLFIYLLSQRRSRRVGRSVDGMHAGLQLRTTLSGR